ncbi:bifunctional glutamate N-acetyltransferase/amino-acid acetyltransferase ArgJ [Meridianimarinicoccus sp. RP-17]|uniref:bifunctional glutamate N-acetyltransferase/amino-acid acetyltransferase ArgJ n=1 Tax=Meridianimarinicoccus zhengii TaxID=2056810 RepID=UPI000DABA599|nr:bifunctional glutamate N-acetyltransferase/amino-acid acetyltransferase ArgJ [Phycocomes zhengii]
MAGNGTARRRLRRRLARGARRAAHEAAVTGPAVSPLAPAGGFPALPDVAGVRLAAGAAGVRYAGRTDVMLAVMAPGTVMAGVTTRSATRSAPVLDCEAKLAAQADAGAGAAIIVNSGNSNAFTGANGRASVAAVTAAVAQAADVPESRVFMSSTGVIGEPLPHGRIVAALDRLAADLAPARFDAAARAIMTTDTFPKGAGAEIVLDGAPVRIAGIAKGSGMIAPDMGTMLVYIFTDARIGQAPLQAMLRDLTDRSFNAITVDSDTSTSDTLLLAATGKAGPEVVPGSAHEAAFRAALHDVMLDLAKQVVRDGEGATKFLEVQVTGAADDMDARRAGLAIANSPLVKTAVAGEDPNWGRVVMAVGKSGAVADRDRLSIWFGPHVVAENGWVSADYREDLGAAYMKQAELVLRVDLGVGTGAATVWTCDLTHGYISINADYRS